MIPKIIHQTWKNNNIPEKWKKSQLSWTKKNPNWKYILWTDKDNHAFIKKYYPWFLKTYVSYPHNIQRADAVRPFLLYHYGGLYVDLDSYCLKNIDNIFIKNGVYILKSSHFGHTNSMMASTKHHSFWKIVFNNMILHKKKMIYQTKHFYIMHSTGPSLISDSIKKYNGYDIYTLSTKYFNPCNTCVANCKPDKHVISYTLHSSSWSGFDTKILNFYYCNYKYIIIIVAIILVILIFYISFKKI
jgi:inositol phosphorylceramide mannosyltransferase catalytic subunit